MDITLSLKDPVIVALESVVDAYNATVDTPVDLPTWILLHLMEVAIARDLGDRYARVETQVNAYRDRLMQDAREELLARL